jgi:hypothetical protein
MGQLNTTCLTHSTVPLGLYRLCRYATVTTSQSRCDQWKLYLLALNPSVRTPNGKPAWVTPWTLIKVLVHGFLTLASHPLVVALFLDDSPLSVESVNQDALFSLESVSNKLLVLFHEFCWVTSFLSHQSTHLTYLLSWLELS